ncbi:hypothetical protein JB92DRAFT_3147928 [Gautieria morchelliformis]|nr:hypothetical protein JB92DRAFT_3147928 [Gautieria morchelliformis]
MERLIPRGSIASRRYRSLLDILIDTEFYVEVTRTFAEQSDIGKVIAFQTTSYAPALPPLPSDFPRQQRHTTEDDRSLDLVASMPERAMPSLGADGPHTRRRPPLRPSIPRPVRPRLSAHLPRPPPTTDALPPDLADSWPRPVCEQRRLPGGFARLPPRTRPAPSAVVTLWVLVNKPAETKIRSLMLAIAISLFVLATAMSSLTRLLRTSVHFLTARFNTRWSNRYVGPRRAFNVRTRKDPCDLLAFESIMDSAVAELKGKFEDSLNKKLQTGATNTAAMAVETSDEFAASMRWQTSRATLRACPLLNLTPS